MTAPRPDEHDGLTAAQRDLYEAMSEISEISYAAGWCTGNEYAVWRLIHEGGPYGQEQWDVDDPDLARVRRALAAAHCWITWTGDNPQAISLTDWTAQLAARPH